MKAPRKQQPADLVKTTVRIDRSLWNAILHRCIDEKLTAQELVEVALRAYLKKGATRK